MCWTGKYKIIKAKEDIPCFKICAKKHGLPVGYFTGFDYELDKEYKTTIELKGYVSQSRLRKFFRKLLLKNETVDIDRGFHSYSKECKIESACDIIIVYDKRKHVEHYFNQRSLKPVLAKCTIPKGSKYLINRDGEIVSNRIIINSIEKI